MVVNYFIRQPLLEKKKQQQKKQKKKNNNNKKNKTTTNKQTKKKKKKKKKTNNKQTHSKNSPLREKSCHPPSCFVNIHNTHAKAYDLSTMSILSVVRYFLLSNQLTAVGLGIFLQLQSWLSGWVVVTCRGRGT